VRDSIVMYAAEHQFASVAAPPSAQTTRWWPWRRAVKTGDAMLVVAADRGLRERISPIGAASVGVRWLTDLVDPPTTGG
jgi:hypothetical protein